MLDLPRMMRIRLTSRPRVQRVLAYLLLQPNYELPPRVRIDLEGLENLPDEPVLFAMNHTDRYNYWPFQYTLWRRTQRYTATWVKGKYYQNAFVGKFMELTNNIPTVSRGYLISRDFINTVGRPPTDDEYTALRKIVEQGGEDQAGIPVEIFTQKRDMLGREYDPSKESYSDCLNALFRSMMGRFVELNKEAFEKNLDVLVFPEGTRSIRLSKGHIGLAQIALAMDRPIVPVGCNGSDLAYPSSSPVAKPGHIVYRIGEPITREMLAEYRPDEAFAPFTPEAESKHRERFQSLVDVVMDRINLLLDERHQRDESSAAGKRGASRFV